jgi:hypothetical protein
MRLRFSSKTIPLALIAVLVAAFGLLIPFLGFYQDDWHPVYYGFSRGLSSLWELFFYDGRPFAAVIYIIGFRAIGFKPIHWQVLALTLRSLTVIFSWLFLGDIWPQHKRQVTWVAILFAIYPLFKLQSLSLIYTIHWTGFFLFSLSIWAMMKSVRKPRYFWVFTVLSVMTAGLQLILLEYYAGIEMIRPFLLWMVFSEGEQTYTDRIKRVMKVWSPYLLLLVAFAVYRIFYLPGPTRGSVSNQPTVVFDFFKAPVTTALLLLQTALQDTLVILYTSWNNVIYPGLFTITQPANLKTLLIIIAMALAVFIYLASLKFSKPAQASHNPPWYRSALIIGLLMTVLGPVPAWLTEQSISTNNPLWSDRYGLAAMIGASLVIVGLLEALIGNQKYRLIAFSALVGLSVGWHVFNGNDYRRSWIKQSGFYWQLAWRAPYIQPGTAILSDGEIFPYMGEYPTSFALNSLYPRFEDTRDLSTYFFSVSKHFAGKTEDLVQGMPLRQTAYSSIFSGNSRDGLVIFYEPEQYECLWVLGPEGADIRALPEITRQVAPLSNLSRILTDSPEGQPVPTQIFGNEPAHTWCYYYEKADLARQYQDWSEVVALWDQAVQKGYEPGNGVEYLPFIEGFAHLGDWETAEQMTHTAEGMTRVMAPSLCDTWGRIQVDTQISTEGRDTINRLSEELQCP